VDSHTIG